MSIEQTAGAVGGWIIALLLALAGARLLAAIRAWRSRAAARRARLRGGRRTADAVSGTSYLGRRTDE